MRSFKNFRCLNIGGCVVKRRQQGVNIKYLGVLLCIDLDLAAYRFVHEILFTSNYTAVLNESSRVIEACKAPGLTSRRSHGL